MVIQKTALVTRWHACHIFLVIVSKHELTHHVGSTFIGERFTRGDMIAGMVGDAPSWYGKLLQISRKDVGIHAFMGQELVSRWKEHQIESRTMKVRATSADVSVPMGPWIDVKRSLILGCDIPGLLTAISPAFPFLTSTL